MLDLYEDLEELCETVNQEIKESNEKIRSAGGKISPGDVEYLDKLTHMMKSIKTTMAMIEAEGEYNDMGNSYGWSNGMDYNHVMSHGNSYGEKRNTRRNSRQRYSGNYSRGGSMVEGLRDLMNDAPNESIRQELRQMIARIEGQR